jgi:FKBP-type peptidyl-prolyl cis-trans isomerase (trigger factor)
LIESKLAAIGNPSMNIVSVAEGKDFVYEIIIDIIPKLEIANYKNLYEIKVEKVEETSTEDIEAAIAEIKKMRTTKNDKGEDVEPEMTTEFLQTLGDYKTLEDLKSHIAKSIKEEKEWKAEDKRRGEIMEKFVNGAVGSVPKTFIENEINKMEDRIKGDLSKMGMSFEDYLKHLKKSVAEWRTSIQPDAEKQAKLQLALTQIAGEENIKASDDGVKGEVAHLLMQHKDISVERATAYMEERMTTALVAEYVVTGQLADEKVLFGSHEGHGH